MIGHFRQRFGALHFWHWSRLDGRDFEASRWEVLHADVGDWLIHSRKSILDIKNVCLLCFWGLWSCSFFRRFGLDLWLLNRQVEWLFGRLVNGLGQLLQLWVSHDLLLLIEHLHHHLHHLRHHVVTLTHKRSCWLRLINF